MEREDPVLVVLDSGPFVVVDEVSHEGRGERVGSREEMCRRCPQGNFTV